MYAANLVTAHQPLKEKKKSKSDDSDSDDDDTDPDIRRGLLTIAPDTYVGRPRFARSKPGPRFIFLVGLAGWCWA